MRMIKILIVLSSKLINRDSLKTIFFSCMLIDEKKKIVSQIL